MKIGILQFDLIIDGAQSLKDKRRVVKSLKDRLHREHMVSIAEVDDLEILNRASLGLVCVAGDASRVRSVLAAVLSKLQVLPDGRLVSFSTDVVDASDVGGFTADDGSPLWTEAERRESPTEPSSSPPPSGHQLT